MNFKSLTKTTLACLLLSTGLYAQDAPQTSFKFDFGTGKAATGYTKVLPSAV